MGYLFSVTSKLFCRDGTIRPITAEASAQAKHQQKMALAFEESARRHK